VRPLSEHTPKRDPGSAIMIVTPWWCSPICATARWYVEDHRGNRCFLATHDTLGKWVGDESRVSGADPEGPDTIRSEREDGHPTLFPSCARSRTGAPSQRAYSKARPRECHYDCPHPGGAARFVQQPDGMWRPSGESLFPGDT